MEELLDTVSSEELSEWMAFYRLEPFGPDIENLRTGILASTVANYSALKLRRRDHKPGDFMPEFKRQKTSEEIMHHLKAFLGT